MYGIFMESWVIFKNYGGNSFLLVLYMLAVIYILCREKDKRIKVVLGIAPLALLFLFFFPIFRKLYVAVLDDSMTYYRLLWLIPMGVTIAYAGCLVAWKHRIVGFIVVLVPILVGGKFAYTGAYVTAAENAYHIPDTVVQICDLIGPKEGEFPVYAIFPGELVYYVRQYNSNIYLAYGRDSVEPVFGYQNELYDLMEGGICIEPKKLLKATRGNDDKVCSYIILREDKVQLTDPLEEGLELIATIDGYQVYFDPVGAEIMEGIYSQIVVD